ncbi:MAG: hypothetical protein ACYCOU_03460 [Sulfobacillus sp.]
MKESLLLLRTSHAAKKRRGLLAATELEAVFCQSAIAQVRADLVSNFDTRRSRLWFRCLRSSEGRQNMTDEVSHRMALVSKLIGTPSQFVTKVTREEMA